MMNNLNNSHCCCCCTSRFIAWVFNTFTSCCCCNRLCCSDKTQGEKYEAFKMSLGAKFEFDFDIKRKKWPTSDAKWRNENVKMFHYHRKAKEASDAKRKRNTTHDRKNEGQRTDSTKCRPMIKETCSICMDPIICRGILAICNHFFCFHCIYEWSKVTQQPGFGSLFQLKADGIHLCYENEAN